MSTLRYKIDCNLITYSKEIRWSHYLIHREESLSFDECKPPKWEFHLDFNIKDGRPCLHFRYYGITLRINDIVKVGCFSNPIELKVLNKPHRFNDKLKEVDFWLVDTDIDCLKTAHSLIIYVVFANGDTPIGSIFNSTTFGSYGNIELLRRNVDDIIVGKSSSEEKFNIEQYIVLYKQALKEAGVNNIEKKSALDNAIIEISEKNRCKHTSYKGDV